MTTTELLAIFRQEVYDLVQPYLWADALVYGYIDDAQKQFCRDTTGIADSRSFTLAITAATEWYPLDTKILKLRDAVDSATGEPVPIIAVEKMRDLSMRFDGSTGPLRALVSGMEENTLRAWPIPSTASTVELRTFRLPVTVETGDDLEIAEQHHRHLLNWVKHLAYDVQDSETSDKTASEKYRAAHAVYCTKALAEQSRARRPVSNVVYGGI